jgi:hypothetical protein
MSQLYGLQHREGTGSWFHSYNDRWLWLPPERCQALELIANDSANILERMDLWPIRLFVLPADAVWGVKKFFLGSITIWYGLFIEYKERKNLKERSWYTDSMFTPKPLSNTEGMIAALQIVVAILYRNLPTLLGTCLQSLGIFKIFRNPNTTVVTQRLRHQRQLRLFVAVNGDTGRGNIKVWWVCKVSTLVIALNGSGTVT